MLQTQAFRLHMIATAAINASAPMTMAAILPAESFVFSPSVEMIILLALFPNEIDDGSSEVLGDVVDSDGVLLVLVMVLVLLLLLAAGLVCSVRIGHVPHMTGHNARILLPITVSVEQSNCISVQPMSSAQGSSFDSVRDVVGLAAVNVSVVLVVVVVIDCVVVNVVVLVIWVVVVVMVVVVAEVTVNDVVDTDVVVDVVDVAVLVAVVLVAVLVVGGHEPSPGSQSFGPLHGLPRLLACTTIR